MAENYILGTVGTAEAFKRNANGELEHVFTSKTLTESTVNISITKDDIRAGQGAPIVASFYHDPNVEINLTDVMWKKEYVEAQLGTEFKASNPQSYKTERVSGNNAELEGVAAKISLGCGSGEQYLVWYAEENTDDWKVAAQGDITVESGKTKIDKLEANKTYCVRYLAEDDRARVAEITSMMVPQELVLLITAPLFPGNACSSSTGSTVGHITFEIPRFRLNGSEEFSMAMSSNATMPLSGIGLASLDGCDIDNKGGRLLRIIEVIKDRDLLDGAKGLLVDADNLNVGETPAVYAIYKNDTVALLDNDGLDFAPARSDDGTWASAGPVTITPKNEKYKSLAITETVQNKA